MTGLTKRAKVLDDDQVRAVLAEIETRTAAQRDRVIVLASFKAGLRAKEIAALTWGMVTDAQGAVGRSLALSNVASKGRHGGREIPLHNDLRVALIDLKPEGVASDQRVALDARGFPFSANGMAQWFHRLYAGLGFDGASSHSGRRTFITKCARKIVEAGGSLRDVQMLAGHASLDNTMRYVDVSDHAAGKVIALI